MEIEMIQWKRVMFCLCALIAILVIPTVLRAASFDCSKASTKTERAICSDPTLSKLDEDMAAVYDLLLTTNVSDSVKKEQRKWLKDTLDPCRGDKECIQKTYENRIHQLKQSANSFKDRPHPAPDRPSPVPSRLASSADQADTLWGTYQGFSRACQASFLVLDKNRISLDECKEASYTTIESDSKHILIEVKPSVGCTSEIIRIEREKEPFGGFTVKKYDNRKKAVEDDYNFYCSYGQVDPSMAKDQTNNFLHGKTGEERRDALRKINGQLHPERDKYNEIGLHDKSPLVRATAAFLLRGNPDRSVPMLINIMVDDPDANVRRHAGSSLSHIYTDNGAEGFLHIKPLESNLDKLLKGLKNVETLGPVVAILGSRYTGDSVAPCYMSVKSQEKVLLALRNELRMIQFAGQSDVAWHNEWNEADTEIKNAIDNITKCHLTR
jgi:uncharacterized protein